MAQATRRVRLATGVTTPLFRFHPAVVAQAAATLDRLSGGRFDLGVGTGENINEGPLGLPFPPYGERARRMAEALEIIRRLLDGEKLTFAGRYYQTDRARLYSPPRHRVALWMAAGGPQSAALAARSADGIITSVKNPAEALEKVILPARQAAAEAGRPSPTVVATRWVIAAADAGEAWQALLPWRGLRAPGRLVAVDPEDLRRRADDLPRAEILGRYTLAGNTAALVEAYQPLVEEVAADVVVLQVASLRQEQTIALLGAEVLPRLRRLAGA
jgi:G6PDH family F420-dependent oxidoreductase